MSAPVADDPVRDACRQRLDPIEQLEDRHRRRRGVAGGLEHERAAGRDRRADLAQRQVDRVVPRRDQAADADRLLEDEVEQVVRRGRRHLAADHPGGARRRTGSGRWRARSRARGRTGSACPSPSRRGATAARPPRAGAGPARAGSRQRWRPAVAGQAPSSKVARAAAIARPTSARPDRGATATRSPVAGSRLSSVSPDAAGDQLAVDVVRPRLGRRSASRSRSSAPLDGVDGHLDRAVEHAARRWSVADRS